MTGRMSIRGLAFCVVVVGISTVCAGQSQVPQISNGGLYPPGATGTVANIPAYSPPTEKELRHLRQRAYLRMRSDCKTMQQLSAELNAQFKAQPTQASDTKPAQGAQIDPLRTAEKIEKLAAEIERLMRGN